MRTHFKVPVGIVEKGVAINLSEGLSTETPIEKDFEFKSSNGLQCLGYCKCMLDTRTVQTDDLHLGATCVN